MRTFSSIVRGMSAAWLVSPILVAAAADPASAADWTQFRGPAGNATAESADAPVTWASGDNLVWRTQLPGPGSSCPITCGDKIFVTCYSGYGVDIAEPGDIEALRLHMVCLDRASGAVAWDRSMPAVDPQKYEGQMTNHGYATATPVTDGTAVFAFFGTTGVVAFDFEGSELWRASVGTKTANFGSASSPLLYEDMVIVNASIEGQSLVALDKHTGNEVWRVTGILKAWNTPILVKTPDGKSELVINCLNELKGFDPATGEQLWRCDAIEDYVCPSMVVHDGVIYAIGGRSREALAVRPGGRGDVTATHRLWLTKAGSNVTSPVYHDGHLYFLDDRSVFFCVDADDGEIVYRERMPAGNRVYASVALAGDKLYAVSRDHGTFVVRAKPEFEQLAVNVIDYDDSLFNASPVIVDGQILLRSDKYLHCIGQAGGQ